MQVETGRGKLIRMIVKTVLQTTQRFPNTMRTRAERLGLSLGIPQVWYWQYAQLADECSSFLECTFAPTKAHCNAETRKASNFRPTCHENS